MNTLRRALLSLAALYAGVSSAEVPAGECDSAARVITAAGGIAVITGSKSKDVEAREKALSLVGDMEIVLARMCELSPEQSHKIVSQIVEDMTSQVTRPAR